MTKLDAPLPAAVQPDRDAIRCHLGDLLPSKRLDENLLVATWNLRRFASLTRA
jgi:hypothetical protein